MDSDKTPTRYVMSFVVKFPHEGDTAYLAHCYPYRYSGNINWHRDCCRLRPCVDLMEDLALLRADPARAKCFSQKVLCHR